MNSALPKISVIIPTLNQGAYISEAIQSVIRQDYSNYELFVVDGGSRDNTVEVIKKHASQIKAWISEKDHGQSHAINKGLRMANGDIITWLNSDDYYEPGVFHRVADLFRQHPDAGIVHGKVRLFGAGRKSQVAGLSEDLPVFEYLAYMRFPQPASFLSRAAIRAAGPLNEDLHYAMDFDLVVKVAFARYKIIRTDALLANYRLHDTSKSNDELKFLAEWTQVLYGVLDCTAFGKEFGKKLSDSTGIAKNKAPEYKTSLLLTKEVTERIFLRHLDVHFHYQYTALNIPQLRRLAAYLQTNYPDAYKANNYGKYMRRLKILPTFVFRFIRQFSR